MSDVSPIFLKLRAIYIFKTYRVVCGGRRVMPAAVRQRGQEAGAAPRQRGHVGVVAAWVHNTTINIQPKVTPKRSTLAVVTRQFGSETASGI